jgi:hypothetical protein
MTVAFGQRPQSVQDLKRHADRDGLLPMTIEFLLVARHARLAWRAMGAGRGWELAATVGFKVATSIRVPPIT